MTRNNGSLLKIWITQISSHHKDKKAYIKIQHHLHSTRLICSWWNGLWVKKTKKECCFFFALTILDHPLVQAAEITDKSYYTPWYYLGQDPTLSKLANLQLFAIPSISLCAAGIVSLPSPVPCPPATLLKTWNLNAILYIHPYMLVYALLPLLHKHTSWCPGFNIFKHFLLG